MFFQCLGNGGINDSIANRVPEQCTVHILSRDKGGIVLVIGQDGCLDAKAGIVFGEDLWGNDVYFQHEPSKASGNRFCVLYEKSYPKSSVKILNYCASVLDRRRSIRRIFTEMGRGIKSTQR